MSTETNSDSKTQPNIEQTQINSKLIEQIKDNQIKDKINLEISDYHKMKKKKRFFTWKDKEECWNRAPYMLGRHPKRWRLDSYGNPVCCQGPFCYTYDHVIPFSKGGQSILENCRILNSKLNQLKSNHMDITYARIKKNAPEFKYTEEEIDLVEKVVFGNVERVQMDFYFKNKE